MVGALLGRAVARAVPWASRQLFGSATRRAATAVGAGVATTVASDALLTRMGGGTGGPPRFPGGGSFAPQGPGGGFPPVPREGIVGRTISRILPGGLTGYEGVALKGTEYDKYGRPIAVGAEQVDRFRVPAGYVIVRDPRVNDGEPFGMLKGPARAMGLWYPKPKPVISGYDTRAIQRAHRAKKRVAKLAKKVAKL